ncbi:MAG: anthranilate synthase component I [Elusimicrobiota bacterium]
MNNIDVKVIKNKIIADRFTPVEAYSKFKTRDYSFLLESVEKGQSGRYSFLGFSPFKIYKIFENRVVILKRTKKETYVKEKAVKTNQPLEFIKKEKNRFKLSKKIKGLAGGGFIGYLGYESIQEWEKINFKNPGYDKMPVGILLLTDELIKFDHKYKTADIIKLQFQKDGNTVNGNSPQKRLKEIEEILTRTSPEMESIKFSSRKDIKIKSNFSKAEFIQSVKNVKKDIYGGEIIQAVLSQRLQTEKKVDPFNYYRALRVVNPSPYMFYLNFKEFKLCGSSPEIMVKVTGSKAQLKPIAGTRPRGNSLSEENKLSKDLKGDVKEKAEHIMLVDLGRNDLGKVCKYGSVKVKNLMNVEKYSHVMHMVTKVTGKLEDNIDAVDVFKASFPAGTVSGAPKIRAIKIIDREENRARGPYAGAVGYFTLGGDMDTCIVIRTMLITKDQVFVQAGAGIVADSVPEKEYRETQSKARALLEAVKLGNNAAGGK